MVRLAKESNPFDGISDGIIKGAVLTVKLKMRLAAAVDEAVAALKRLTCCAAPSSGSRCLHISPAWLITMASSGCSQRYRKEHFD
jgi:hypothetical protein